MGRRWATVGVAAVAVVGLGCHADPPATAAPPSRTSPPPTTAAGLPVLGLGGCAARGCHGGPVADAGGRPLPVGVPNAASFWLRYDKHGAAFQVLRTDRSIEIINRLRGEKAESWRDAPDEPRCLACHVTPALLTPPVTPALSDLRYEGVSCDACHTKPGGSTRNWYGPHQAGWPPAGSSGGLVDCYATRGMQWLGSAQDRAATCVGCHVGAPGDPPREVTHDMIAAGHPRLNFEYLTYLAMLPPHWAERSRRRDGTPIPMSPGHHVQAWFAGQVEAARAGLTLYVDRAGRATGAAPRAPWPELADFNCYACHHDLRPGWPGRSPVGRMQWTGGNISDPLARLLGRDPEFAAGMADLRESAAFSTRASATALRDKAGSLKAKLDGTQLKDGRKLLEVLRLRERAADGSLGRMNWDEAAQTYYALRAVNRDRPPRPAPDEIDRRLDRLAAALSLPRTPVVNSPTAAQVLADLVAAFDRLPEPAGR